MRVELELGAGVDREGGIAEGCCGLGACIRKRLNEGQIGANGQLMWLFGCSRNQCDYVNIAAVLRIGVLSIAGAPYSMSSFPPFAAPLTDSEIVEYYRAGTLLTALLRPLISQDQETISARLAARHNARDIDVLELLESQAFANLERHRFFIIQRIYCAIIPLLNAAPLILLAAVQRLVFHGGNDGMATLPREAMRRWMEQDASRPGEIISAAQSDPNFDLELLRDALVTLGDMGRVRAFLEISDPRRRSGIAALGGIPTADQQDCEYRLEELLEIAAADANEEMRFTAIFASFKLLRGCRAAAPKFVPQLVAAVAARPSEEARTALLQDLWQQSEIFQSTDIETALAVVCEGNLTVPLLHILASVLSDLVGGPHHDVGVACLTNLLGIDGKAIPLDQLASLEHFLMALDRPRLFALAVKWFSTSDRNLCEAAAKVVLGATQQAQPFDDTFAGRDLSGGQMVVICHKAIGYMPLASAMSASFVVAALRGADKSVESELIQLLFQSILINFGDAATSYLKTIGKQDVAGSAIRKALKLYGNYEKGLHISSPIKEILPSSYQRAAVRQKHYATGREIHKEAERQSIFFDIVQRSTLLYGHKAIAYARGADQPPISMEMKTISSSFNLPSLDIIDPVGSDWLRRIFQISKPK